LGIWGQPVRQIGACLRGNGKVCPGDTPDPLREAEAAGIYPALCTVLGGQHTGRSDKEISETYPARMAQRQKLVRRDHERRTVYYLCQRF